MIEVNMGDTVRLPCLVDRLEGFVMMWKKKEEILTVATQIIDKVNTIVTIQFYYFQIIYLWFIINIYHKLFQIKICSTYL